MARKRGKRAKKGFKNESQDEEGADSANETVVGTAKVVEKSVAEMLSDIRADAAKYLEDPKPNDEPNFQSQNIAHKIDAPAKPNIDSRQLAPITPSISVPKPSLLGEPPLHINYDQRPVYPEKSRNHHPAHADNDNFGRQHHRPSCDVPPLISSDHPRDHNGDHPPRHFDKQVDHNRGNFRDHFDNRRGPKPDNHHEEYANNRDHALGRHDRPNRPGPRGRHHDIRDSHRPFDQFSPDAEYRGRFDHKRDNRNSTDSHDEFYDETRQIDNMSGNIRPNNQFPPENREPMPSMGRDFRRGPSHDRNNQGPPKPPAAIPSLFDIDPFSKKLDSPEISSSVLPRDVVNRAKPPPVPKAMPPRQGILPLPDGPPPVRGPFMLSIEERIANIRNDPLFTEDEKHAMIQEVRAMGPANANVPMAGGPNENLMGGMLSLLTHEEAEALRRNLPPNMLEDPEKLESFLAEEIDKHRDNIKDHDRHPNERFRNFDNTRRHRDRPNYDRDRRPDSRDDRGDRGWNKVGRNFENEDGGMERKNWKQGRKYDRRNNSADGKGSSYAEESEILIDVDVEIARSNDLYQEYIAFTPEEQASFDDRNIQAKTTEKHSKVPPFLMCPLCKDLLDDPVVLPCFHTLCRKRCIPRLMKNENSIWCPQCVDLKFVKCGVENLQSAETFQKLISEHKLAREKEKEDLEKERKEKQEGEDGETNSQCAEHDTIENIDSSEDLTCRVCNRLYSLPVTLSCGHAICKFPCAYRSVEYNSKILCAKCEKPTWVSSVGSLPIDKRSVKMLQQIKGERYLDVHAKDLRKLEDERTAEQYVGITALFDEDDVFSYRLQLLSQVAEPKEDIPSILTLATGGQVSSGVKPEGVSKSSKKKKKKKKLTEEEEDFNPEELFPSEEPPQAPAHQYPPDQNVPPLMGFGPTAVDGAPVQFDARQFSVPPPGHEAHFTDISQGSQAGFVDQQQQPPPAAVPAPFQPPILDVKAMVPENAGPEFDYIAPWNLFAQQTQNYYTTYYASVGGVPAEAQQQVKEYLEKCWSWYSAYFKMQSVKNEAKATADKKIPSIEPATEVDANELATKVKKLKTAKNKKEKEKLITEFSYEVAAAVTKDEKQEAIEIEELKILLLKKQLELKLKTAKSKSEARDLKKLKELVEEEEGKEGEELDEDEKKKKAEEEKAAKEKDLEDLREAARKKQLEREKQIEELEKKRKRTRQEELKKLQRARKRTQEKREKEERGRSYSRSRSRSHSRSRSRSPSRRRDNNGNDDYYRGKSNRGDFHDGHFADRGRGGYRGRGGFRGRGRGYGGEGDYGGYFRGGFNPRGRGGRGRGRGYDQQDSYESQYDQGPYAKRRKTSRSPSRSRSRSRSYSRSRSRSGSRGSRESYRSKKVQDVPKTPIAPLLSLADKADISDDKNANEPKFIKVTNLPDDVTAKSLKSFVEAFGRVINCKIGKMQGEMMAVCQMQNMSDAIGCVREMHGLPFKGKMLDVKYMGNKPIVKQVEVTLPDVHDRTKPATKLKPVSQTAKKVSDNFGGSGERLQQRKLQVMNLPWGTTEREVIDFVSHHAFVLHCRVTTSPDRYNGGLYAEVVLESYFDVLKCINALHGTRFEGRELIVKKVTV